MNSRGNRAGLDGRYDLSALPVLSTILRWRCDWSWKINRRLGGNSCMLFHFLVSCVTTWLNMRLCYFIYLYLFLVVFCLFCCCCCFSFVFLELLLSPTPKTSFNLLTVWTVCVFWMYLVEFCFNTRYCFCCCCFCFGLFFSFLFLGGEGGRLVGQD